MAVAAFSNARIADMQQTCPPRAPSSAGFSSIGRRSLISSRSRPLCSRPISPPMYLRSRERAGAAGAGTRI